MKKFIAVLLSILSCLLVLPGCYKIPEPSVKSGRFDFSITYEVDGVQETVSSVFVCEFVGIVRSLEGGHREWNTYIEDDKLTARLNSTRGYLLLKTVDDGEIFLDINLSAKYFMSDPHFNSENANLDESNRIQPRLFIEYSDAIYDEIGESYSENPAVLQGYGVKVISYEYDAPIENTYK